MARQGVAWQVYSKAMVTRPKGTKRTDRDEPPRSGTDSRDPVPSPSGERETLCPRKGKPLRDSTIIGFDALTRPTGISENEVVKPCLIEVLCESCVYWFGSAWLSCSYYSRPSLAWRQPLAARSPAIRAGRAL